MIYEIIMALVVVLMPVLIPFSFYTIKKLKAENAELKNQVYNLKKLLEYHKSQLMGTIRKQNKEIKELKLQLSNKS